MKARCIKYPNDISREEYESDSRGLEREHGKNSSRQYDLYDVFVQY